MKIKAQNKIIEGKYKEYKFKVKMGQLYLCCLENEIDVNSITIYSVREIGYSEYPEVTSMVVRGYLGNLVLGMLGIIVGLSTAKRQKIHRLHIIFSDGGEGIAEVDDVIYNKLYVLLSDFRL